MPLHVWTVLMTGAAAMAAPEGELEPEVAKARAQLLLSHHGEGEVRNHSSGPNGGRTLPWPTILTAHRLKDLLDQDMNTGPNPTEHLHVHRATDIGGTVIIPSGVGLWARPTHVTWSHNRRLMWEHNPDRPDWLDHRVTTNFDMVSNYDLHIGPAQLKDAGTYTARFQLKRDGPIYEMNTKLAIYHLPKPKLYEKGAAISARRLQLKEEEASREITCASDTGLPRASLTWARDNGPVSKEERRAENGDNLIAEIVTVTHKDHGALLTCFATNNRTSERTSTSIMIQSLDPEIQKPTTVPTGDKKARNGIDDVLSTYKIAMDTVKAMARNTTRTKETRGVTKVPKWEMDNMAFIYAMAATALTLSGVAATLSIISSCSRGHYSPASLTDLPPPIV